MWRNDRERPDDPQTRERETQRLSRDEYERPRYGSAPQQPQQHRQTGPSYERATWSYTPRPGAFVAGVHRNNGQRFPNVAHQPEPRPQRSQPQPQHQPIHPAHEPQGQQQRAQQHFGREALPPRSLDDIRAHDLMTRRVATVHPATSVERAARLMDECDCGALPVVGDNGVLIGMVTDRDIAIRVVARGRELRNAIVADCMTDRVIACYADEPVSECMRQMARHQVRRIPIVDDRGRLVGIVAQGDLARHAGEHRIADEPRALAQLVSAVSEPGALHRR